MTLDTLKTWRLVIPGIAIVVMAMIYGSVTSLWQITSPQIKDAPYSIIFVLLGVAYYITPIRSLINGPHHRLINERIRSKMVQISGFDDNPELFSWNRVRRIFYRMIDSDESLKVLAKNAYFNGLIWTSCADVTAISLIFLVFSLVMNSTIKPYNSGVCILIYFCIALAGLIGSFTTTRNQIKIGAEQLQGIEQFHREEVRKGMDDLVN